jgi:hypothetical protein
MHVKDAELNPTGKQGTFGGYQSWLNRADVIVHLVMVKLTLKRSSKLSQYDFKGWAVME